MPIWRPKLQPSKAGFRSIFRPCGRAQTVGFKHVYEKDLDRLISTVRGRKLSVSEHASREIFFLGFSHTPIAKFISIRTSRKNHWVLRKILVGQYRKEFRGRSILLDTSRYILAQSLVFTYNIYKAPIRRSYPYNLY